MKKVAESKNLSLVLLPKNVPLRVGYGVQTSLKYLINQRFTPP
ncbi:MAG: hypothetical protein V7K90_23945 [Nostoc sp.]